MLYLSRLMLNHRSRQVRRDLADCQELHRSLMRAFPDDEVATGNARERVGLLHRVEVNSRTGEIIALVQSTSRPDWSALDALGPDYLLDDPVCKDISAAYDEIREGDRLVFRLRANPSRRIHRNTPGDPLAGKRVALHTEPEQQDWLLRKGEQAGFEILTVQTGPDIAQADAVFGGQPAQGSQVPGTRATPGGSVTGGRRAQRRMTFGAAVFDGYLEVTDADRLRRAIEEGIGPAKAYGFGLLSIARMGRA